VSEFSPELLGIDQDNLRMKLNRCCRASHDLLFSARRRRLLRLV